MKKRDHKILYQDNQRLAKRLKRQNYSDQAEPMFQPGNLHYEMAERGRAIGFGGIGAVHTLVTRLELDQAIILGLHGDCRAGVEPEKLVRADGAGPERGACHCANGVQELSAELHPDSVPDCEDRAATGVPRPDLHETLADIFRDL